MIDSGVASDSLSRGRSQFNPQGIVEFIGCQASPRDSRSREARRQQIGRQRPVATQARQFPIVIFSPFVNIKGIGS